MQSKGQFCNSISRTIARAATAALAIAIAIAIVLALTVVLAPSARAQTFTVLHNFTGGPDGATPQGPLTMDQAGNLYGTDSGGGRGFGTVYMLSKRGSNWIFNALYAFAGGNDGSGPWAGVIIGPDGSLYGTTTSWDTGYYGTVFNLKPPATACKTALCPWTETVLYRFSGSDGANPGGGHLIFDQSGNLYSVTLGGGAYGDGTVFELVPSQGGWTESVLHSFYGGDGYLPNSALVFDNVGNLYGTALLGGAYGNGTVFQLTPSGSGWTENTLYSFQGGNDGDHPYPGVIFDPSGNLYGGAAAGGQFDGGTVFKLTPSGGGWTFSLVYSLTGPGGDCGPVGNFIMDAAGNIYGLTNYDGAYGAGTVFKLTPSGGGWTYTLLHDFNGSDGSSPNGGLILDENGNLYGAANSGGAYGAGVIFEITP